MLIPSSWNRLKRKRLSLIDFDDPSRNHYLAVRELWVRGRLWLRRPDLILFVNGLPLVFIELKRFEVHVAPLTSREAAFAREAHRRFGRGVGEPAVLNYGDCLAYAVARSLGWPLLCVGSDFVRTDLPLADVSP
jgi:hypothetical protein